MWISFFENLVNQKMFLPMRLKFTTTADVAHCFAVNWKFQDIGNYSIFLYFKLLKKELPGFLTAVYYLF
jgi:hypothetical protein